ncbi:hypothetical protein Tco_1286748 [Tanacetum coccineum]
MLCLCGALYTINYVSSKGGLSHSLSNRTPGENFCKSLSTLLTTNVVTKCGDSLDVIICLVDGIFCQRCTCKSCEKGAHHGYNCPPKVQIISNPGPCNNQTIDELPQTLLRFDPTCYSERENSLPYVSKPNFVDDSPNVFNPPPQPPTYSYEFCGNDAYYGYDCPPQVPFIYPEPCYNQDFNFPQNFHNFQQQYLCCENCGGPHETFQCQPMNQSYYEPNPCYDSNSFGFDQFQPPQYTVNHPIFNAQNELFNSQNKLMEQLTSVCDMVGQYIQKKEEEKRIEEEQAAKARYWKIPVCYDDDDDEERSIPLKDTIISGLPPCVAITPALSTEEPIDSLIIENEHLDTILETELDGFITSSVENLVQNPSESEDFSDIESECDMPVCDNFTTFSNLLFDANDDFSSSDDESFSDEDVPNEIYSNPLFDEEIISVKIDASIISMIDSLLEQFFGELAHNDLIPPGINEADFDLEEDIRDSTIAFHMDFDFIPSINDLGSDLNDSSPSGDRNKIYDPGICIEVKSTRFLATHSPVIDTLLPFSSENEDKVFNHSVLASKEKSPPSSSHRAFKASNIFHHKSLMLIHEDNTPNLGVRHPHFYPP